LVRLLGFTCTIILCLTLVAGFANAGEPDYAEVFLVPEQGFIRVNARFSLPGGLDAVVFTLFPNAQITTLWVPGLATYEVSRPGTMTVVTARMEPTEQNAILELTYEGFLPNYDLLPDKTLNRNLQWYPEFAHEQAGDRRIKITLPQEFVPAMDGELIGERQSTFATYTWMLVDPEYPVIWFGEQDQKHLASQPDQELETHESMETVDLADAEPIGPPTPPTHPVSEQEEPDPLPAKLTAALDAFNQAVTGGDRELLESILDRDFPDRSRFIDHIAERPETGALITSRIAGVKLAHSDATVYIEICDGQTLHSNARLVFHEVDGTWLVKSFVQVPARYQFQERLDHPELQEWIGDLARALSSLELPWFDYHLTGAKIPAIAFLQQIHGQIELSAAAVDLNRNQIEFLAQTKAGLPLRLQFGYFRYGAEWRIKTFAAVPSFDK